LKIKSENFLTLFKNNYGSHNILLFYGPNFGLVNLLFKRSIELLSIDLNDPFNVSKIDGNEFKDNPYILNDNVSTFTTNNDKRTILLDLNYITINKTIESIILNTLKEKTEHYLLLIKASNLGTKSELVRFIGKLDNGIVVPCYDEDTSEVKTQIAKLFNKYRFTFSPAFLSLLCSKFNSDTSTNLMELNKLESFLIDNDEVTEKMILSLITDNIDINSYKIVKLCSSGKIEEALISLEKIYENSNTAINITKLFVIHFKIIEKILLAVENGSSISKTINNIKPPIFFMDRPLFIFQCQLWSLKKINHIFKKLIDIELKLKSNFYPSKTLLSQFILSTALIAKKSAKI
jgi:DNA polymerase III subunit delta